MGALKKDIKNWHADLNRFWQKFNTFKRIVIGIILSGAGFYYFSHEVNIPLQNQIRNADKKIKSAGVPDRIPDESNDKELNVSEFQLSDIRSKLAASKKELKKATASKISVTSKTRNDAIRAVTDLLTNEGLSIDTLEDFNESVKIKKTKSTSRRRTRRAKIKKTKSKVSNSSPFKTFRKSFVVSGNFNQFARAINAIAKTKYPVKVTKLRIAPYGSESGKLYKMRNGIFSEMNFVLEVYYSD